MALRPCRLKKRRVSGGSLGPVLKLEEMLAMSYGLAGGDEPMDACARLPRSTGVSFVSRLTMKQKPH